MARRRNQAAALRAEGLPVRAVAERLGVSHPTVLRDLKAAVATAAITSEEYVARYAHY
jgi:IS30 family transposase